MADIKTRDAVKGTIKSIDKAAVAGQRMKQTYVSTKDRAEQSVEAAENSANEYASDRVERGTDIVVHEGVRQLDKAGRKGVRDTKDNIRHFKGKRAEKALRDQANGIGNKTVKTAEKSAEKTIKQSVSSAGKKTIKTAERTAAKTAQKSVKTAKTAIKTTQQAAKTAQKTAQATVKASQKAAQAAKAAAKATAAGIKAAVKATIAAVKAIIAGVKALVAAIAAGGWVAVVVILVICLVALILGSVFGIFFSGEDSGTGMSMQSVVREINAEYDNKLAEIKNGTTYDVLEMSGSRAVWKKVNCRPSQYKKNSRRSQSQIKRREHEKSSVKAKVEHVFAVVKGQLRYRKTRYRGLRKQTAKLNMLFALANLILADRPSRLAA